METVFCECKKCDAPIGRFVNLWTQIGKSYFSPVVEPEDDLAVVCQGAVRIGERGTLVEECQLQDIACRGCAALLGLRCIQTPVNHVLDENQLLLRLASVDLLNDDGQEIEFVIKRVLSVHEPSKVNNAKFEGFQGTSFPSAFPATAELQQLQLDLLGQREDIKRIDTNGFRIVSALDRRAGRVEGEVTKLKDTVPGIRRDIGNLQQELGSIKADIGQLRESGENKAAVAALQDRLASVTSELGEVGNQLAALDARFQKEIDDLKSELIRQQQEMEDLRSEVGGCVDIEDHTRDMEALRAEMTQLRREMADSRSQGAGRSEPAFPSRELDVLTSNIAKIGNRASQVETLQMELEILKGRVERAEASRQADEHRTSRRIDPGPLSRYSDVFPGPRKRAASPDDDSPPKRPASSIGSSVFPNPQYPTPPSRSGVQPTVTDHEDPPKNDGTTHTQNSGRRGRNASRGGTASTQNGISSRLRKR